MKTFFTTIFLLSIIQCCSTQNIEPVRVSVLSDSIRFNNEFIYLNEIYFETKDRQLQSSFINTINKISFNKFEEINSFKGRLLEKKIVLGRCIKSNTLENCSLAAENYEILALTKQFLNIRYSYSQYGSYMNYKRNILINLLDGKIITGKSFFQRPDSLLKIYNHRYISSLQQEISKNKDQEEIIDVLSDYCNNFKEFTIDDLQNIEVKIDKTLNKIEKVRVHYNGIGGYFDAIWPSGYIEFEKDVVSNRFLNE